MNSAIWLRVEEIFHVAVELTGNDRKAFLDRECAGEEEILREVELLLEAEDRDPTFLERPLFEQLSEGHRIGDYRIQRELGRGGMGTVYLATVSPTTVSPATSLPTTRPLGTGSLATGPLATGPLAMGQPGTDSSEPKARAETSRKPEGGEVAIKVLKQGLHRPFDLRRFAQEQRILASLDHPHIARFLDGGLMDDGRPFLVMEYIDGETIDRHCDQHQLSVDQRLRIFLGLCEALHHAHQKLFVHRDLKPSNVLVSRDGVAKVLDFGTAKLLKPRQSSGEPAPTLAGLAPLTPAYSSPEQVRGTTVDTRTDVFGLGLVLYELLTGRRAYRFSDADPVGLMREVCYEETLKPSSVVEGSRVVEGFEPGRGEVLEAERIALARGSSPASLRRSLEGDLDNIILMALRKEPGERYGSVGQLAEDIRRHLSGLPVKANRGSLAYQSRKFLKRHPKVSTAAMVIICSILLFGAGLAHQFQKAKEERARAELERDKAEHVAAFLVDLFEQVEPQGSGKSGPSALQILDRGTQKVLAASDQPPELEATLMEALGTGYSKLAHFDQALDLLEEAKELRKTSLGEDHLDTAASLHQLGNVYVEMGRFEEAEPLFVDALATRQRHLGERHPKVSDSLESQAELYLRLGKYELAEKKARRSLLIRRAALGPQAKATVNALRVVGLILRARRDTTAARAIFEEVLEKQEKLLASDSLDIAQTLYDLGLTYRELGEGLEAQVCIERALQIYQKTLGDEHPYVAAAKQALGSVFNLNGETAKAVAITEEAILTLEAVFGKNHESVATSTYNLGYIYFLQGDFDQAEPIIRRALELQEQTLGKDHPHLAYTFTSLGVMALDREDLEEAESFLVRGLDLRRATASSTSSVLAISLHQLSRFYLKTGQLSLAEPLLREAHQIREGRDDVPADLRAATLEDLERLEALQVEEANPQSKKAEILSNSTKGRLPRGRHGRRL